MSDSTAPRPDELIVSDPQIMGGVPCVRDTRLPVSAILATLAFDLSPDGVIEGWPQLTREDIRAVVQYAAEFIAGDGTARGAGPLRFLATSGRRAQAALMIAAAAVVADEPLVVADALDAVSAAVMSIAGVEDGPARAILATLWAAQ